MNPLVAKVGKWPIKVVNTVAGGNVIDALKETHNPLLRRAITQVSPDSPALKRLVSRYGTKEQQRVFKRERTKTHLARIATIAGGASVLTHERKRSPYAY